MNQQTRNQMAGALEEAADAHRRAHETMRLLVQQVRTDEQRAKAGAAGDAHKAASREFRRAAKTIRDGGHPGGVTADERIGEARGFADEARFHFEALEDAIYSRP